MCRSVWALLSVTTIHTHAGQGTTETSTERWGSGADGDRTLVGRYQKSAGREGGDSERGWAARECVYPLWVRMFVREAHSAPIYV